MSTAPLATSAFPTLADAVDDTLAAVLAGRDEPCLWCGGAPLQVVSAVVWTGAVTVRCPRCGTELDGVVARDRREVRR
jgi:hypothetical protein